MLQHVLKRILRHVGPPYLYMLSPVFFRFMHCIVQIWLSFFINTAFSQMRLHTTVSHPNMQTWRYWLRWNRIQVDSLNAL